MSLTARQAAALRQLAATWPDTQAVIIGATALGFYYDMSWRKTSDVDLVVALELEEFPGALLDQPGWRRHQEFELAPPYLLGVDVGGVARAHRHRELIDRFLARLSDPDSSEHALMRSRGPSHWRDADDQTRRLAAFAAGLAASTAG